MSKYTKLFNTQQEYNAYINGTPYLPNVSLVKTPKNLSYNEAPFIPPILSIGTVCYYNTAASHLKFCSVSDYNPANGPAVGVVAVPNNCTPDGSVRILALSGVTSGGTPASSENKMTWGKYGTDTGLPNLTSVPTWTNSSGSTSGFNSYAYAPSDKFSGQTACYGNDSVWYYNGINLYVPPILTTADTPNPDCLVENGSPNTNCLLDFDGAGNTAVLVGLGSAYTAANACANYSVDGMETGWYLPACGELVYILPKFNVLQSALSGLSGVSLIANYDYWSSSEYSADGARNVTTYTGNVNRSEKDTALYVRPFAKIELTKDNF